MSPRNAMAEQLERKAGLHRAGGRAGYVATGTGPTIHPD